VHEQPNPVLKRMAVGPLDRRAGSCANVRQAPDSWIVVISTLLAARFGARVLIAWTFCHFIAAAISRISLTTFGAAFSTEGGLMNKRSDMAVS